MSALPVAEDETPPEPSARPRSATHLGQRHGLTGAEMNILLCQEGYLEGDPGAYRVTDKGAAFATERIDGRGTGGYMSMNPSWGVRTWDPAITDELDITPERRSEIHQAAVEQRRQAAQARAAAAVAPPAVADSTAQDGTDVDVVKVVAVVAVTAAVGFAAWKAAPHVKRLWKEKASPGIARLKARATGSPSDPASDDSNG